MGEENSFKLIEKYKSRLNRNNEFKKVLRALQRLNEVEMSIELLQATGIGKVVNSLRKEEGLGDLAKGIVNKWKKMISDGVNQTEDKQNHDGHTTTVKNEPVEYDPSGNWEVEKSSTAAYTPSVKSEPIDNEYDPTQNWKLKNSLQEGATSTEYVPSPSPPKKKSKESKKRKNENGKVLKKQIKKEPETDREAELRVMLQKAQDELKKIEKEKNKSKVKIKVEKQSPERPAIPHSSVKNEPEEYDPQCNYQLQSPPATYDPGSPPATYDPGSPPAGYDPGSPGSSSEYEPSSLNRSIEYDPGPGDSDVNYKPSSMSSDPQNGDPSPSRVTDDEDSYEEDEPGAYLLHPRRVSFDKKPHSECSEGKESEEADFEESAESSFVCSTTLYSRHKSVDSEDGVWASEAKFEGRLLNIEENEADSGNERTISKMSSKSCKKDSKNVEIEKKRHKKQKSSKSQENTKPVKIKKEKISPEIKHKSKSDAKHKNKESGKRKSTSKDDEPVKKKVKGSDKKVPKDAGFLFEDIPVAPKGKKKKKKKNSVKVSKVPEISPRSSAKLDLHLPQIQTTYRPLPHSNEKLLERKSLENALTDNEAAALHSKRQTKKMLVYSGGGGGFLPTMMSLFDQCMSVLLNNIDAIDVIGGIPYDIIKPVLKRCTAEQLYRLEDSNPYLLEDTDQLWKKLSHQEFKGKVPDEMESWREMFLRLHDEREAKLQNLTQLISAKEAKKKPLEKKVLLAYVGTSAKAPRNVLRAQAKYGTGAKKSSYSSERSRPTPSSTSSMRQELVESRMRIPQGSITAATVDKEDRFGRMKDIKKSRVAPMMAKTLKSMGGRMRLKR